MAGFILTMYQSEKNYDMPGLGLMKGIGVSVNVGGLVSIMDSGKGKFDVDTESWIAWGTNLMVWDAGTLKVTYVDDIKGAYVTLNLLTELTENLVVGEDYKIKIRAKDNVGGNATRLYVGGYGVNAYSDWLTTAYTWVEIDFTAANASGHTMRHDSMAAGNIVWIDEWAIYK